MAFSPLVDKLISALRCLPGVGPKSAQRMTIDLLERNRDNGKHLANTLLEAMENVGHCELCRTFCETETCQLCAHPKRNPNALCIVENPANIMAMEQTGQFRGMYFVLMGLLSPLDGIGPEHLGLDILKKRFETENIQEVILATNPTVEGEATAHYIANLAKKYHINSTRLAYGIPIGGELDFVDGNTLAHAFNTRTEYEVTS